MKYLHTMIRVFDLEKSLTFWCSQLGLHEDHRIELTDARCTLIFLRGPDPKDPVAIELTYNWDQEEPYSTGRSFGHVAYEVENIYAFCAQLQQAGVLINRPPRDGFMAFIRSPDGVSVELLQQDSPLPPAEPWVSMPSIGSW